MRTSLTAGVAVVIGGCLAGTATAQARIEPFISVGVVSVGTGYRQPEPYTVATSFRPGATIGAGVTIRPDRWLDVRLEGILNPAVGTTPAYSGCLYASCVNHPLPLPPPPRSATTFGRLAAGIGFRPNFAAGRARLGFGATWAKTGGVALERSSELGGYVSMEATAFRWGTRSLAVGARYTGLLSPVPDAQRFFEPTVSFHF